MRKGTVTVRSGSLAGLALALALGVVACKQNPPPEVIVEPQLPPGTIAINFQPAASAVPDGYKSDTGAAYDDSRGYGWITEASAGSAGVPFDVSAYARERKQNVQARLNTFIHMQFPTTDAVKPTAAWEYKLANGFYSVTVGVGDADNNFDSTDQINIEGKAAISSFAPKGTDKFNEATLRVEVKDGRLTVDAKSGTNTKIDYVVIQPGDQPSIRSYTPHNGQTGVATTASFAADLNLTGQGVDPVSLKSAAVRLTNVGNGAEVPAQLNTSGGGDAVVLQPNTALVANTQYRLEVTSGLKDLDGKAFLPMTATFTTGASIAPANVQFEKIAQTVDPLPYTSVEVGPDGKLYASTLTGEIMRFTIQPDGSLTAPQKITSVQAANGGPRSIIGLKFDPASTASNLILWTSNGAFWNGKDSAPDWSGKITRLSGPDLATVQDYVIGLPRSNRDHQTNSVAFKPGENNFLYVSQGSNSAMGAPDNAWGNRPERLLSGSLLRVDLSKITTPPLNVQTEQNSSGTNYNPYAPGAAVTIYATGIRNAYDMVWHSNGQLYVPTNGSAAGGNTPAVPASLPASCANRADKSYTGPAVPARTNVDVQHDFLFRVVQGGYYGHPNPLRCEYVLNGGNPTAGADPAEVPEYPAGTQPDPNYRGFAYDFGLHASANGVIEEYTSTGPQTAALNGKLMVVRYSAGKDIILLTPDGPNKDIGTAEPGVTGLTNFNPSPLDITEDRTNGHIYVAQLDELTGKGAITLVRLKK
ncbi:Ig-like domain-containing protein [Deinococcus sp.]|uniref:Ig-like domain-containing protein n=1 Tax=Deinococcus sp. TaxID=47478 RepID=UPI003B5B7BEE